MHLCNWPPNALAISAPAVADASSLDREGFIEALTELDQAHETGEISDAAYRDQRLRLKAQLRDLLRKDNPK